MQKSLLPVFTAAALLSACSIIPENDPIPQYALQAPSSVDVAAKESPVSILIDTPQSDASLDTQRIAVDVGGYRRDYIANSQWTDKLPRLVQDILLQTFQNAEKFQDVGRPSAGVLSDYMLQSDIREFAARYETTGKAPKVIMNAHVRLMDMQDRKVEASKRFSLERQAPENNLDSIVATFNDQVQDMAIQILEWALKESQVAESEDDQPTKQLEIG